MPKQHLRVDLNLHSTKKHSYRYDAVRPGDCLESVYIMKHTFPNGAPDTVTVIIEREATE